MGYRRGKKVDELSEKQLVEIRRKERRDRRKKKLKDATGSAEVVKARLKKELDRPLTGQEIAAVDSEERRKAFVHFFYEYNGNVAAACVATGIVRATFNRWLNQYPEIRATVEEATEAVLDLAEQQLMKNISEGKEQSLFFLLCNKGRHRGWQDIRRTPGPQIKSMKVYVGYPDKKESSGTKRITADIIESKGELNADNGG